MKKIYFANYDNLEFIDHIEQREKEILKVKLQIDELKSLKKSEKSEVGNKIDELKGQIQEINEQIKLKEKFVPKVESGNIPELESLASDYYSPISLSNSMMLEKPLARMPVSNATVIVSM